MGEPSCNSNVHNCKQKINTLTIITNIVVHNRSEDYVVLEAPEFQPDPQGPGGENMTEQCSQGSGGSGVNGFTNVPECHYVMNIISICQPRKHIYVIFILLVPVIILFGANL